MLNAGRVNGCTVYTRCWASTGYGLGLDGLTSSTLSWVLYVCWRLDSFIFYLLRVYAL